MKKSIFVTLFSIAISLTTLPSAYAVLVYTGELSTATTPEGLTGSGVWGDSFKIEWTITENDIDNYWHYSYSLTKADGTTLDKDVSHFIFEISDAAETDDFWGFEVDGVATEATELKDYNPSDPGDSNPNLPGTIHGIKIDVGGGTIYSFNSTKAPVWGDFYSKDGKSKINNVQIDNAIWNTDFLLADPTDPAQNGLLSNGQGGYVYKLLRPDTFDHPDDPPAVPEPSTFILVGIVLVGIWARRFRLRLQ